MTETKLDPQKMDMAELLENSKDAKCKKELLKRQKTENQKFLAKLYSDLEKKQNPESGAWETSLLQISDHIKNTFGAFESKLGDDLGTLEELVILYCQALLDAQKELKNDFSLKDFEFCCAVSNDCLELVKQLKDSIEKLEKELTLSEEQKKVLHNAVQPVLDLYSADALYAAQKISYFVFHDVYESQITSKIFTAEWLEQTEKESNQVHSIFDTVHEYLLDLERYLNKEMQPNTIQAVATKFCNYYLQQLMERSTAHNSAEEPYFADLDKALEKIDADIDAAREFFLEHAVESNKESIGVEFDFLNTIHHLLAIAAGTSKDDLEGFVKLLQTRIQNYDSTYYLLGDLFHLVNPAQEQIAYDTARAMSKDLKALDSKASDSNDVPGLSLRGMLADQIALSKGKRNRIGDGVVGNIKSWFGKSDRSVTKRGSVIEPPKVKAAASVTNPSSEADDAKPEETPTEEKPESSEKTASSAEDDSSEELEKVQTALAAADKKAREAEAQLEKMKQDLAAANARAEKAEEQIQELKKSEGSELEKMKQDLAAANARAEKAAEQAKAMKTMEEELERIRKDLSAAEEKAQKGTDQIKQLEGQVASANSRARQAEERAKELESRSDPAEEGDSAEC